MILQLDLTSSASSRILNVSSAIRNELPLYSNEESERFQEVIKISELFKLTKTEGLQKPDCHPWKRLFSSLEFRYEEPPTFVSNSALKHCASLGAQEEEVFVTGRYGLE